ncbi:hypothetical protein [Sulfurimonas sp.]|jgi:outer membrane protein assembly factor BamE (lipoprotein component of BamABCDE complex)|uniref:hypothetical protein n=1 Tax=Sulfurimonas sp. TaxID=2022749 RepID=UPI0025ECE715|nr:hypothetical protein [Sulfurimonas sp.]MCK9472426.1 hypothetical protein [Sulfurimonas sp.]MDD3505865.1 hypothetical protein [Sulfurimonas sp.]
MKIFITVLSFLTLFSGCSTKNAFFGFDMNRAQELSASSLQSSKIISKDGNISGIFSVIYLNEVYPKSYNQNEYFYVFMFTKESKVLYDSKNPKDTDMRLTLNSKPPLNVEKLPEENQFSHLANTKNDWNQYYLVTFEQADTINLTLEDNTTSSRVIKYKKE